MEDGKLGMLVLTNSKEQSAEIYTKIKEFDPRRLLKVSRLGSVSFVAPRLDVDEVLCKKSLNKVNE